MEELTIESIIKTLNEAGVKVFERKKLKGFNRDIEFEVRGQKYTIEWWSNISHLYVGDRDFGNMSVDFICMGTSTTNPRFGLGLVFGNTMRKSVFTEYVDSHTTIPILKNHE